MSLSITRPGRSLAEAVCCRTSAYANIWIVTIYASTRTEELAVTGWPQEVKAGFLAQQFAAQDAHYREHHYGYFRSQAEIRQWIHDVMQPAIPITWPACTSLLTVASGCKSTGSKNSM